MDPLLLGATSAERTSSERKTRRCRPHTFITECSELLICIGRTCRRGRGAAHDMPCNPAGNYGLQRTGANGPSVPSAALDSAVQCS